MNVIRIESQRSECSIIFRLPDISNNCTALCPSVGNISYIQLTKELLTTSI